MAALLLVLIFFGVRQLTREKLPVRVGQAERQNLTKVVSTNGKVEPQFNANFEAHAPAAGIVEKLLVRAGDKVTKGQLLLRMDDANAEARAASALAALRTAQAALLDTKQGGSHAEQLTLAGDLGRARLDRDAAQRDLATLQRLQSQGAASPSEVTAAEQRLALANATLSPLQQRQSSRFGNADLVRAQANIADAEAAYSAASQVIAQSNVRAPFAGTVYSLPVSQTEFVQEGQLLLQLADLSKLQVRAYFDEPEIGALRVGFPVTIVWDALHGRTWHGRILRVPSTIISYETRNVGEVTVSIDDADGVLLPNTNVTVTVTEEDLANVLTVPREALHSDGGKNYVFLLKGNTLHRVPVTVGAINLTQVQITSGLADHDAVALSATNGEPLADGVPVRPLQ